MQEITLFRAETSSSISFQVPVRIPMQWRSLARRFVAAFLYHIAASALQ